MLCIANLAQRVISNENRTNPDISGHFDLAANLRPGGSAKKIRDTGLILEPRTAR